MLKDPRWDKEPTLAAITLWASGKPIDERYDWPNCRECLVGQYLRSIGIDVPLANWDGDLAIANQLAHGRSELSMFDPARKSEWTFGKFCDRVLEYQMSETKAAPVKADHVLA